MNTELEFEAGNLVKVNGMRPEHMDGHQMIALIRRLAGELADMKHQIAEVTGTVEEYVSMPCDSLEKRLARASDRAKATLNNSEFKEKY